MTLSEEARARRNAYQREYLRKYRRARTEADPAWAKAERAKQRERDRRRYDANPELERQKAAERSRRWRAANPEKAREWDRARRAANPEKVAAKTQRSQQLRAEFRGRLAAGAATASREVTAEALRAVEEALKPHWSSSRTLGEWSNDERRSLSSQTNVPVWQLYEIERHLCLAALSGLAGRRKQQGLTQRDLAALAGVDPSYLSQIETGQRDPSAQMKKQIEHGLGATPGEIFPGAGDKPVQQFFDDEFFSEFLTRARVENGLSWIELAVAAGVGMKAAGDWLMGRRLPRQGGSRTPPREKLGRIAAAVGYPLSYVIECWERTLEGAYPQRQNLTCIRGHLFDETNTYWTPDGDRQCRACRRLRGPGWPSRQQPRPYRPSPRTPPRNESGYRGVRRTKAGCWAAGIMHGYQTHYLGIFTTPEQAARAYDARATELKGERARLNFPVTA